MKVNKGVKVFQYDNPITNTVQMVSDTETNTTIFKHSSLSWYLIKRGERFGIRLKDSNNPPLKKFTGIERFPVNLHWNFDAEFVSYDTLKYISIPNVLGTIEQRPCPGYLQFSKGGKKYTLEAIGDSSSTSFFIIFTDDTNGETTYGAGRFLYAKKPENGIITNLDFNKAYNPPCAFTPFATCPLPPLQNRLNLMVNAGEKVYGDHH